jgi:hypothetical protein
MNKLLTTAAIALSTSALIGCGGGGGGGGTSPTLSAFTSWSNVEQGTRVLLNGDSQEASYTASGTNESITVDSVTNIQGHASGAELIAGSDSSGNPNFLKLTTAAGTILEFSQQNGASFEFGPNGIGLVSNASGTEYIIYTNPYVVGFEYQTFGNWTTGGGTGSGKVGEFSVGAATPVSNMPISGTASYVGLTTGRYVNQNSQSFFSVSSLEMNADFGAGSLNVLTSGTEIINEVNGQTFSADNLNMEGVLTIQPNSNQFSGSVTTRTLATEGLDGTASGRFFGPSANEVGGTFQLQNDSGEFHSGAFGAVQSSPR